MAAVSTTDMKASCALVPFDDMVCIEMSLFLTFRRTASSSAEFLRQNGLLQGLVTAWELFESEEFFIKTPILRLKILQCGAVNV